MSKISVLSLHHWQLVVILWYRMLVTWTNRWHGSPMFLMWFLQKENIISRWILSILDRKEPMKASTLKIRCLLSIILEKSRISPSSATIIFSKLVLFTPTDIVWPVNMSVSKTEMIPPKETMVHSLKSASCLWEKLKSLSMQCKICVTKNKNFYLVWNIRTLIKKNSLMISLLSSFQLRSMKLKQTNRITRKR